MIKILNKNFKPHLKARIRQNRRVLNKNLDTTNHNERALIRRKYMGFIFQSSVVVIFVVIFNVVVASSNL